jgi:hypothetical protein
MQLLSDLITNKAKEMDIAMLKAKPMSVNDLSWIKCKEKVMALPNDYMEVMKKNIAQNRAKKRKIIGGYAIESLALYEGHEVELYMLQAENGNIVKAQYIAWDNRKNVCFIRDLLDLNL